MMDLGKADVQLGPTVDNEIAILFRMSAFCNYFGPGEDSLVFTLTKEGARALLAALGNSVRQLK